MLVTRHIIILATLVRVYLYTCFADYRISNETTLLFRLMQGRGHFLDKTELFSLIQGRGYIVDMNR